METHVKIGQSILKKYSEFADKNTLDDEDEYFPTLKIIIEGVVESYNGAPHDKDSIGKKLADYAKQLYVDTWLKYAKEDVEEPDIEEETLDAMERFNKLYFIKRKPSKGKRA
jgi:hypothetical protein